MEYDSILLPNMSMNCCGFIGVEPIFTWPRNPNIKYYKENKKKQQAL